jgi:hypothetical protein
MAFQANLRFLTRAKEKVPTIACGVDAEARSSKLTINCAGPRRNPEASSEF